MQNEEYEEHINITFPIKKKKKKEVVLYLDEEDDLLENCDYDEVDHFPYSML